MTQMPPLLPTYRRAGLAFERGEGVHLYTNDGRAFLDFASGIAVNALGHCHPHLVAILQEQATKLWHTSNLYQIPDQERLAKRLLRSTFAETVFFSNSGAEALECALKMARRYHHHMGAPERYRIITFEGAFHGRTLATIAAGGQSKHLEGFGPPMDGFDQVPFADSQAAEAAIGPQTAGMLLEPIQGEGGVRPVPLGVLRELRALCDRHGILLILDEVQSGVGRTGRFYAHEWAGIKPDILASAKGLGGGFPIGACLARARAAEGMVAGSHGSTFGGNPLAMAAANAVLDVILAPGFLEEVRSRGGTLSQQLNRLPEEYPDMVDCIRGEGLMQGVKLKPEVQVGDVYAACLEAGLLTVGAGDNTLRILPPLIITDEEIGAGVSRLETALTAVRAAGKATIGSA